MNIVQDLRERRGLFQLTVQMMVKVGKECEGRGMGAAAKQSFAAAYVLMGQMNQIDQALAVLDEGTVKTVEVEMVCAKCGQAQNLRAVFNLLMPEDGKWENVNCQSCEGHMGHIRRDAEKVPKAYALTVHGVLDYEADTRTNEERRPEALAIGKGTEANADDLPPAKEIKARLLGEALGSPIVAEHRAAVRQDIRAKLAAAKAKISGRKVSDEEDDF